ncbi:MULTISPECIES: hypothetical protein [unclassified Streptosporangium]|uniref:hypothetical protein n=1 Tax=unclassified Streptosporangium TaxID=2632669 RepID=UPI002E2E4B33|nr:MULTISPECIES: hypothetical protein [unclassified Streptosporangium]
MPVATDRPDTRRTREPGTPPRPLVVLASIVLATGTGTAIWLLPSRAQGEWAAADRAGSRATPSGPVSGPSAGPSPAPVVARPSGFVTFVDAVREPRFNLSREARRSHVRWFTLGHLTAGQKGCVPKWGGLQEQGGNPVANRLAPLRAAGGNAGLAFGGPTGRELAAACSDLARLTAAYRRAIGTFDATYIDFEVHAPAGEATVLRRARAIAALQREAAREGRSLTVSFTLPVTRTGLSSGDQAMLRATRSAGAEIAAVNLLAPVDTASGAGGRLRPVASAVRAAHPQIARSLGESAAWNRIALTPVLAGSGDLTRLEARRLAAFTSRNHLAWLSTRGAVLSPGITRFLTGATR